MTDTPHTPTTEEQAAISAAAEAMEEHILSNRSVSMVELERVAAEHIETSGSMAWVVPGDPHIIIWAGMSDAFVDAMDILRKSNRIGV